MTKTSPLDENTNLYTERAQRIPRKAITKEIRPKYSTNCLKIKREYLESSHRKKIIHTEEQG